MSMEVEASSELSVNGSPVGFINQSGLSKEVVLADVGMREMANHLSKWVDNARAATGRNTMFDPGAFVPPDNPYDEMRSARHAVRYDSVVSGVAEITEAFAFQGTKWESSDPDEADIFNQLAIDQNLDGVVRKMWKEEFTYSQAVMAKMWGWVEYTSRVQTKSGNKKKKKYKIWAPLQIRTLDSLKVVPIGVGPLGGEALAWQATLGEIGSYSSAYQGDRIDPLMTTFFQGGYEPGYQEIVELTKLGVIPSRLLVMNPDWVFRHTVTKPDYERFADIRLKSVFMLLDLKRQLMQADRASLIGAANYILLIRKGTENHPAQGAELDTLKQNYNFIAKMPVIIADHRLSVDIIAPKTDLTLNPEKYEMIDQRILNRLLGTLSAGGRNSGRGETQDTLSASVARVMENRRHMLKRTIEIEIARAITNHPKNAGVFQTEPNLVYTPRRIALTMDAAYAQGLQALRTQREISRETILEFFGLDESVEAMRMEMEAQFYDDIFKTEIPYTKGAPDQDIDPNLDKKDAPEAPVVPSATTKTKDGPNKGGASSQPASGQPSTGRKRVTPNGTPEDPSVSGARGGRPVGGGRSAKSPAAIAKPKTPNGNPRN